MDYSTPRYITEPFGNNAFAWKEREANYGNSPTLFIPSLIDGDIDDIQIGDEIVFEEMENGILRSCTGLKHFVRIPKKIGAPEIIIFDNHNHALYFWIDAVRKGIISPGFELIHIDEHSDLWPNEKTFDLEKAIKDEQYAWEFINFSCNVGNYIQPAIQSGLVGEMIRIENESEIDQYMNYQPNKSNTVLNIDIDIFSPELDFIPESKIIHLIRNLLPQVNYVTIATSPYFIDQGEALNKLRKILL